MYHLHPVHSQPQQAVFTEGCRAFSHLKQGLRQSGEAQLVVSCQTAYLSVEFHPIPDLPPFSADLSYRNNGIGSLWHPILNVSLWYVSKVGSNHREP